MTRPAPNASVLVRPAVPADHGAVGAVLQGAYPFHLARAYGAETLKAALPFMVRANPGLLASGTYHVAELSNGEVVGCGGWTREQPGSGTGMAGLGHLRHFAVKPGCGRRGIGRAVLARCEDQAAAEGIEVFECWSVLSARRFYERAGFAVVEPRDLVMGAVTLPILVLRRTLPARPPGVTL